MDESYNALVSGSLGELGQLLAGFLADADTGRAAEGDETGDAGIFTLAGYEDVVETPAAGLEGFLDRMQAVENFHVVSVEDGRSGAGILCSMHEDPMAEWQRLTQLYREMGDGELEELDAGKGDLTEVAQQVLRDEIRKRGLDGPSKPGTEPKQAGNFGASTWGTGNDAVAGGDYAEASDQPVEYTWKTPLCECEDREEAWQIYEVLRQAGIESWIEGPGYGDGNNLYNPRIVVGADQLEKAHEIVSRPIPQEIVEQSKMDVPDYVPPVCPSCGAEEPVLENAELVNAWRCETCGKQWSEQMEEKESPAQPQSTHKASEEANPYAPGPLLMG
jgi:ribosomal protein L37AE/L43A